VCGAPTNVGRITLPEEIVNDGARRQGTSSALQPAVKTGLTAPDYNVYQSGQ
jgi:hypothetical protein